MTDQELATACARNETSAQRLLYERYRIPLFRMCLRYARDSAEAEDFLHDGMLKAYQKIDQYRGTGALGGWVRRIVLNTLLRTIKQRPTTIAEEYAPEFSEDAVADSWDFQLNQIDASEIFALVREIPAGSRTVFNLYYLEGMTHRQIAKELNITEGGSKSQLYKAKQYLRQSINTRFPHYQYRKV